MFVDIVFCLSLKSTNKNYETKNNSHMGRNLDNALDRWTTPGSILPLTPFEQWQFERYGNFIPERPEIETNETTYFERQIELYEYNEIFDM